MPTRKLPFQRVRVVWLDAYSTDTWENFKAGGEYPWQRHEVITEGWLIAENDEYVAVAASVGPDPEGGGYFDATGIMHIPRKMVVSQKKLKKS